jgi:outer membrane protein TolC
MYGILRVTKIGARAVSGLAGAALLASAGCAVGPDFKRPAAPEDAGFTTTPLPATTASAPRPGGEAETLAIGRDIAFDWWAVFHSPALDTLVKRALLRSPSIETAQATLRGAQYDVYAQLGYFAPNISAGYSFERQQLAGNESGNAPGLQGNGKNLSVPQLPVAPYNQPITYNLHTAQLTVGYTPDVFGSNIRQVEGLRATQRYQRFQLEAAYITLASNVVAAAIQEAETRAQPRRKSSGSTRPALPSCGSSSASATPWASIWRRRKQPLLRPSRRCRRCRNSWSRHAI